MIVFGFEPYPITVVVAAGSVFSTALQSSEPWPPTTRIALRFLRACPGDEEPVLDWPASLDDQYATWDVPAGEVDELVSSGARVAHLFYNDTLWGKGRVDVVT